MKTFFILMTAIVAVILLFLSILIMLRKGKPLKKNKTIYKTEEERIKAQKEIFVMGIMLFIQTIAMLILSAGIYFEILFLYLTALVFCIPVVFLGNQNHCKKDSEKP